MGAERVRQHGQVQSAQIVPELVVVKVVVHVQAQPARFLKCPQFPEHFGRVGVRNWVADFAVDVHVQLPVREFRHGLRQYAEHRQERHVGTQALGVTPPPAERVVMRTRSGKVALLHHMRMGKDRRRTVPPSFDFGCSPGSQRDEVCCRDQEAEGSVMGGRIDLVGIAQVVHGVHKGLAIPPQGAQKRRKLLRRLSVEPEVQMEHVKLAMVSMHPVRVEHDRRPPPLRRAGRPVRPRVTEAHDSTGPTLVRTMPHIYVARWHRCDPHHPCTGHLASLRHPYGPVRLAAPAPHDGTGHGADLTSTAVHKPSLTATRATDPRHFRPKPASGRAA